MNVNKSLKETLRRENVVILVLVFVVVALSALPLSFVSILAHEGGHGLLVVPALVLNRGFPRMPEATGEAAQEENAAFKWFENFPPGIAFMFLSFPLGAAANGLLCYLSYKNAWRYRLSSARGDIALLGIFLSFGIMNLKAGLSNLFGPDFAFIWQGIGLPYGADWFRALIQVVSYLALPLLLALWKGFAIDRMLAVAVGTFVGATLAGSFIFQPLLGTLLGSFWWLFVVGLPVLVVSATVLWWLQSRGGAGFAVSAATD